MGLFSIGTDSAEGSQVNKSINVKSEDDFIQEGKITKYELSDDNRYIKIEFANTKGQTSNGSAWLPKAESDYSDADAYKKAVTGFMNNMTNISRKLISDTYTCDGRDAVDVATKVINAVSSKLASKTVFCKMDLNKSKDGKIYTNVSSYSPFAFSKEDIFISNKQKDLLKEKLAYRPDAEKTAEFKTMPDSSGLPF